MSPIELVPFDFTIDQRHVRKADASGTLIHDVIVLANELALVLLFQLFRLSCARILMRCSRSIATERVAMVIGRCQPVVAFLLVFEVVEILDCFLQLGLKLLDLVLQAPVVLLNLLVQVLCLLKLAVEVTVLLHEALLVVLEIL